MITVTIDSMNETEEGIHVCYKAATPRGTYRDCIVVEAGLTNVQIEAEIKARYA